MDHSRAQTVIIVIQTRAGQQLLATDPLAAAEARDVIKAVAVESQNNIGAVLELMDPEHLVPLSGKVLDDLSPAPRPPRQL